MRSLAWRIVVVLPYAGLFVLSILWLREPNPPGPRWLIIVNLVLFVVLGVETVRRWRRNGAQSNTRD